MIEKKKPGRKPGDGRGCTGHQLNQGDDRIDYLARNRRIAQSRTRKPKEAPIPMPKKEQISLFLQCYLAAGTFEPLQDFHIPLKKPTVLERKQNSYRRLQYEGTGFLNYTRYKLAYVYQDILLVNCEPMYVFNSDETILKMRPKQESEEALKQLQNVQLGERVQIQKYGHLLDRKDYCAKMIIAQLIRLAKDKGMHVAAVPFMPDMPRISLSYIESLKQYWYQDSLKAILWKNMQATLPSVKSDIDHYLDQVSQSLATVQEIVSRQGLNTDLRTETDQLIATSKTVKQVRFVRSKKNFLVDYKEIK